MFTWIVRITQDVNIKLLTLNVIKVVENVCGYFIVEETL